MGPSIRQRALRDLARLWVVSIVLLTAIVGIGVASAPPSGALPPQASLLWSRSFGPNSTPAGVMVTLIGDIFVVGTTTGNLDGIHAGNTAGDLFVARFDRNGRRRWLRQVSSPGDHADAAADIAISGNGDLYLVGTTRGNLDGLHPDTASTDGFVARYSRSGQLQWITQFGTSAEETVTANVVTSVGDIFVSGSTRGNLDGAHPSPADADAFVVRLDRSGQTKWVRQYASSSPSGDDVAASVTADSTGMVVLTGSTRGNLDGKQPSITNEDAFVLRLDRTGKRAWTTQFSPDDDLGDVRANDVVVRSNQIFIAGSTSGNLDGLHPGAHANDAFIAAFSSSGDSLWTAQIGSAGDDSFSGLVLSGGTLAAVGRTAGDIDGAHPLTTNSDRLVVSMTTSGVTRWISQTHSDSGPSEHHAVASNAAGDLIVVSTITNATPTTEGFVSRFRRESLSTWTSQLGTATEDRVDSVALTPGGDLIAGGTTRANLDGENPANTAGDGFLARYAPNGQPKWVSQFGRDPGIEEITGVATNWRGDTFAVGRTTSDLDEEHPSASSGDAFVARFDADGDELWVRQFDSTADDRALAVATTPAGDVFVVGSTTGDLDGLHAGNTSRDGFVIRLDRAGNVKWIRQVGDPSTDEVFSGVGASSGGDVYAGGSTTGNLDGKHASSLARDALLVRLDRSGKQRWLRQFGTAPAADEEIEAVGVSRRGEIFVTGSTSGDLDGKHATNTSLDAFVIRYSSGGSTVWLRQVGTATASDERGTGVSTTTTGLVFITGTTTGNLDGASSGNTSTDAFALRYLRTGRRQQLVQFGGAGNDTAAGIAGNRFGAIYVGGYTDGRLGEVSGGALDAFVTRLAG